MVDNLNEAGSTSSLTKGDNEIPTMVLGETGYNGLTVLGGQILEECQHELRWPYCMSTYKKMAKDGSIAPALNLVELMVARVPWSVKIPEGYEEELKDKAVFLQQCMNDMEEDWGSFIRQVESKNRYGFSLHEKVYRYRYKENGSKYNDGLIGIRKMPIRSQDTIISWEYKNQGRDFKGVYQLINKPTGLDGSYTNMLTSVGRGDKKFIPRKKFLLFRNNPQKDSPQGESPLVGAWASWKMKKAFEEAEAIGCAQDSNGFKVLYLPPKYMTEDASDQDKAVFEEYKKIMANMHVAKQSGMILPLIMDEAGNKLFEFDIKSITGQKSYDTDVIIKRYTNEILTALFADFLGLGSNGGGSFALSESKVNVIEMAIEAKLTEIKNQLNHDLVPQLFELNGWDTAVTPHFTFGEIGKQDLDVLSKYLQRIAAAGALSQDANTINWIAEQADMPKPFDDPDNTTLDKVREQMTTFDSNAGEGMKEGLNSGTGSANGSGGDSSIANNENT